MFVRALALMIAFTITMIARTLMAHGNSFRKQVH
jgi:hypothetical protein